MMFPIEIIVLTNTIFTLSMMFACKFIGLEDIIATFMTINFPIEVLASAIIVPILLNTIKRLNKVR